MPIDYNGESFAFCNCLLSGFPGDPQLLRSGLRGINISDEAKFVEPKGAGAIALPRGAAYDYTVSASIILVTDIFEELLKTLKPGYAEVKFNLEFAIGRILGGPLLRRTLQEAQLGKITENWGRDDQGGLLTSIDLPTRLLFRNGVCLVRLQ